MLADLFGRTGVGTGPNSSYLDTFKIRKQFFAISEKFGFQKTYNRITIDCYAGIGFRMKYCDFQDQLHPEDNLYVDTYPRKDFFYNPNPKGWISGVSVPFNIRIGYRF